MGSGIRARKPTTLKRAFKFCIEEQNIVYAKRELPNSSRFNNSNRDLIQNPVYTHTTIPYVPYMYHSQMQPPTIAHTLLPNHQFKAKHIR